MNYKTISERLAFRKVPREPMDDRKMRLKVDVQRGEAAQDGINSDFYIKVLGPILTKERETAIKQISQPNPDSSRDRLSAKLELVEIIMNNISAIIERGNKAGIELEEIRKKENG